MIKCRLSEVKIPHLQKDNEKKYGIYSNSFMWSVRGYGERVWAVHAHIEIENLDEIKTQIKSEFEITKQCIQYLNELKDKKHKPLFNIESNPHKYKFKEKNNKQYIEVTFLTKDKKNRMFLGEGIER